MRDRLTGLVTNSDRSGSFSPDGLYRYEEYGTERRATDSTATGTGSTGRAQPIVLNPGPGPDFDFDPGSDSEHERVAIERTGLA